MGGNPHSPYPYNNRLLIYYLFEFSSFVDEHPFNELILKMKLVRVVDYECAVLNDLFRYNVIGLDYTINLFLFIIFFNYESISFFYIYVKYFITK